MNGSIASTCATSRPVGSAPPSACPSKKTAGAARCRAGPPAAGETITINDDGHLWLPRRDVMLNGLSGVAAGLAWHPAGLASGADSSTTTSPCKTADKVNDKILLCTDATTEQKPCPLPSAAAPVDFTPASKVTRVRQPVHLLSRENQERYKEAVRRMKTLPPSNPLSFAAQAVIHQAYCDSYYKYDKPAVVR